MTPNDVAVIAVSVGNTNTAFARCAGDTPGERTVISNAKLNEAAQTILALEQEADPSTDQGVIAVASVNENVSNRLADMLIEKSNFDIARVGQDIPVLIPQATEPSTKTGIDRLLNALAAHTVLAQACVVVDAGTAITADFVDGEGTFQGGAIAAGLGMMLWSLHDGTATLPRIERTQSPNALEQPFGKSTEHAMILGSIASARGMVHFLTERYAEAYGAFPLVIATGGDADLLFAQDDRIDRVVPDLTLRGIAIACSKALTPDADDDQAPPV